MWAVFLKIMKNHTNTWSGLPREGTSVSPGRWSCLEDGRLSQTAQIENTVRHMKSGHTRSMVVYECSRSTGVQLPIAFWPFKLNFTGVEKKCLFWIALRMTNCVIDRGNQEIVEEAFLPTLQTLMEAPATSPLSEVNINNVAQLLIQLTNSCHLLKCHGRPGTQGAQVRVIICVSRH